MTDYDSQIVILQVRRSRWPDSDVKRFDAVGWSRDFRRHGPPGSETHIEAAVILENGWGFADMYPVSAQISADEICTNLVERCRAAIPSDANGVTQ